MNITALDDNFSHLINVAQASSNQTHMVGFRLKRKNSMILLFCIQDHSNEILKFRKSSQHRFV